jgi:flagellar basal body-associated protein FliL
MRAIIISIIIIIIITVAPAILLPLVLFSKPFPRPVTEVSEKRTKNTHSLKYY